MLLDCEQCRYHQQQVRLVFCLLESYLMDGCGTCTIASEIGRSRVYTERLMNELLMYDIVGKIGGRWQLEVPTADAIALLSLNN